MATLPPPSPPPGDDRLPPAVAARLERLERRRAAARPAPDDRAARLERLAQRSRPPSNRGDAPRARRPQRNHPAQRARTAALGVSLASTAGLALLFASLDHLGSEPTASAAGVIVSGGQPAATTTAPSSTTRPSIAVPNSPTANPPSADSTAPTTVPHTVQITAPTTGAPTPQETAPSTTIGQPTVVDGASARNRWGDVQLEVTFGPDGSMTDIVPLRWPNSRGTSERISEYAIPRLAAEALSAQSAQIHGISGATYTSQGFKQSLQSAIDTARAAGVTSIA